MCSLETLGTIPTSRLVFVENVFTSLVLLIYCIYTYACRYMHNAHAKHNIYNYILYYIIMQLLTLYINPCSIFKIIKIVHFNEGYSM